MHGLTIFSVLKFLCDLMLLEVLQGKDNFIYYVTFH